MEELGFTYVEPLGKGGMAFVFRARDPKLNAYVAVKVMRNRVETTPGRVEHEIKALAGLKHANIVSIRGGLHDVLNRTYFTMEFVEGETLEKVSEGFDRHTTAFAFEAAAFIRVVALAVHDAHVNGVVHRDLKPANILVVPPVAWNETTPSGVRSPNRRWTAIGRWWRRRSTRPATVDHRVEATIAEDRRSSGDRANHLLQIHTHVWGTPKVADFGLAKLIFTDPGLTTPGTVVGTPNSTAPVINDPGLTIPGTVVGTPSYMAPEQTGGNADIGRAADIWALGVILYELLTARLPYTAQTTRDLLDLIESRDELPREYHPRIIQKNVPRDLEAICLKCLRKQPADRYPSAAALADDLERFLRRLPVEARRPPSRVHNFSLWCIRNRVTLATVVFCSIVGAVLFGIDAWHRRELREKEEARQREFSEKEESYRRLIENGYKELAEPTGQKTPPEQLLEICQRLKDQLNFTSNNPREAVLARMVRVQLGKSYLDLGRTDDAVRELSDVIVVMESSNGQMPPGTEDVTYRALKYLARTFRALAYVQKAQKVLPLVPTDDDARKDEVATAATDLARSIVDLNQVVIGPEPDASSPLEYVGVEFTKKQAKVSMNMNLARLRYLLDRFRRVNQLDVAVKIADILDQCPTLLAGEPHYDIACTYALASVKLRPKEPRDERLATATIRHLRRGNECGFGVDPIQMTVGKLPKKTLRESILTDADFAGIKDHPALSKFLGELEPQLPRKK